MSEDIDVVGHVIVLLDQAKLANQKVLRVRIGEDLKVNFERDAGVMYADGKFAGYPVTFDPIDPSTAIVETEPA
jgi:hypothetical protein